MAESLTGQTAYITGAASGIAKAVAEMLVSKGIQVFLADRDLAGVEAVAASLNASSPHPTNPIAHYTSVDVSSWPSQLTAFILAVQTLGHIDHVYPIAGIGERRWIPPAAASPAEEPAEFTQPDLATLDVDLNGVLYTIGLAVQQFRRQEVGEGGWRGRIGCVASICGLYCASTLPVYTAAKHGLTGFIRSYGAYLPSEKIALNGVSPNVVRTNISSSIFYNLLESQDLLTPIEGVVETFERLLDGDEKDTSGAIFEVGPCYGRKGERGEKGVKRDGVEFLDGETERTIELLSERGLRLQVRDL